MAQIGFRISPRASPPPEYVSDTSAYATAAASVLTSWTGSDHFGYSGTLPAGSSKIEPGVAPAHSVVLSWPTFTDAADEAGMSRRYGGLHFRRADLAGRKLGRLVASKAWSRAQSYFDGGAIPKTRVESMTSGLTSLSPPR